MKKTKTLVFTGLTFYVERGQAANNTHSKLSNMLKNSKCCGEKEKGNR